MNTPLIKALVSRYPLVSVGVGGGGGARGSRWSGLLSGAEDPGVAGEMSCVCVERCLVCVWREQMKGGCWR